MAEEKASSKGQAWFCTTGLPSDIAVEVEDMTFYLHKVSSPLTLFICLSLANKPNSDNNSSVSVSYFIQFPLMSKSRKLHQLITEQETNPATAVVTVQDGESDDVEEIHCQISLPEFPGGSETFELVAKFCYGVKFDLTSFTVGPLRCAGEFLEMTEEYSEDNLVSKTERYLSHSVLKSLKESVKALTSCERVMPLAETLGIPQRCIDSITSRASSADPALFGWPVTDNKASSTSNQALWNGIESAVRRKGGTNVESWFEHLAQLSLRLFTQLILAMKSRDLSPDIIECCLMHFAKKHIPGVSRSNRKPSSSSSSTTSESEQREILETIVSNLSLQKSSTSPTATRFVFGLLRTANILNASERCRSALEKKIGLQLDQATLDDLLIPSYSYLNETLYDVDCLERILAFFLETLQENGIEAEDGDGNVRSPALMLVGKLVDGYLAEIASDSNLKPDRFYNLATSLPDQARLFDDGLYRAVDVYLKAHPWISEVEREKICGVLDCQKLTLEACTHAAQNERLPLRAVVQVLFFEQLQLRHAIAGTLVATETAPPEVARMSRGGGEREEEEEEDETGAQGSSVTWRAAVRENQVLRLDMDSMRTRVHQLERDCSHMRKVIEKIETEGPRGWLVSLNKRLGCKFKTQVCDSHEQAVVNGRKGRQRDHHE
ncbi:hypothetical protein K2173_006069 [Erythroxylum novogranatense]|uniref:NPH3 domain-containing protein n=1 Tax=Erythroxylum novogranatense TaxID=1862640 RepID=A0AAV8TDP1_9ROSI|nr:hypothetical protein K2173_006069 [Erythroxylum novogranatense]